MGHPAVVGGSAARPRRTRARPRKANTPGSPFVLGCARLCDEMTPMVGVALGTGVLGNQSSLAVQNLLPRTTTRELIGKEQGGNAERHRVADNHGVNRMARRRRARRQATCMRDRSHESASFLVSDSGTECDGCAGEPQ